ncbi:MAG: hypothetical protein O7C56_01030 [Rickettsia endosymbiont of Ixodes persulcatus]|nr:hypothetical protein [Rickettsia endosymbiont of Ixodes persulcatus]
MKKLKAKLQILCQTLSYTEKKKKTKKGSESKRSTKKKIKLTIIFPKKKRNKETMISWFMREMESIKKEFMKVAKIGL